MIPGRGAAVAHHERHVMIKRHTPAQSIREAHRVARERGMYIIEKPMPTGAEYLLYRRTDGRGIFIGKRVSALAILQFVKRAATTAHQEAIPCAA
jgi:hypothetical protein